MIALFAIDCVMMYGVCVCVALVCVMCLNVCGLIVIDCVMMYGACLCLLRLCVGCV